MNPVLILVTLAVLTACSATAPTMQTVAPGISVPITNMNHDVHLEPTVGMVDMYMQTGGLTLLLRNTSARTIRFPPDFGVRVFSKRGDVWVELQNDSRYPENGWEVPPEASYPDDPLVDVMPEVSNADKLALRIVVIGKYKDTGEEVGAFFDFSLSQ